MSVDPSAEQALAAPLAGVSLVEWGQLVEHGRDVIGRTIAVSVTSTLQTSAGRLVFARPEMHRG